jgi:alpha-galactosidase/6-phospho-beta-glucosidase family protein
MGVVAVLNSFELRPREEYSTVVTGLNSIKWVKADSEEYKKLYKELCEWCEKNNFTIGVSFRNEVTGRI